MQQYGTAFPGRDLDLDQGSRRGEFGLGTIHRTGDEQAPPESAIDKVGGDSRHFLNGPTGYVDPEPDQMNWSNADRNRYGSND